MKTEHPLRKWRKSQGLTLVALAEKVGVGPSHLSQVECCKRQVSLPLASRIHAVSEGQVPYDDMLRSSEADQ